jgi:RimJ/RimL family protein N-acetyltransferase
MNHFFVDNNNIHLSSQLSKWDTEIFGFNVAVLDKFKIRNFEKIQFEFNLYKEWLINNSIKIVSCRLENTYLEESFFLEESGFRFIEMVLHPTIFDLQNYNCAINNFLVLPSKKEDLKIIKNIALNAFSHERYHLDPRFDNELANIRYETWVNNTTKEDSNQLLLKIIDNMGSILAFFVIEELDGNSVYWHLTAVNPEFQNKKLGYLIWMSVINYCKNLGFKSIDTTISARNIRVLNLYSKLNFRFKSPDMTFHLFL